jgi:hypothetical protein
MFPVKMDNTNSKLASCKKRKLSESIVAEGNSNNIIQPKTTMHQQQEQWFQQEKGAPVICTLSFLYVKSLLQKDTVSETWRKLSKRAIPIKAFQFNE